MYATHPVHHIDLYLIMLQKTSLEIILVLLYYAKLFAAFHILKMV